MESGSSPASRSRRAISSGSGTRSSATGPPASRCRLLMKCRLWAWQTTSRPPCARQRVNAVSAACLSPKCGSTALQMTQSNAPWRSGGRCASACTNRGGWPSAPTLAAARRNISCETSSPTTRPRSPTAAASRGKRMPVPQPASSTRAPAAMPNPAMISARRLRTSSVVVSSQVAAARSKKACRSATGALIIYYTPSPGSSGASETGKTSSQSLAAMSR